MREWEKKGATPSIEGQTPALKAWAVKGTNPSPPPSSTLGCLLGGHQLPWVQDKLL